MAPAVSRLCGQVTPVVQTSITAHLTTCRLTTWRDKSPSPYYGTRTMMWVREWWTWWYHRSGEHRHQYPKQTSPATVCGCVGRTPVCSLSMGPAWSCSYMGNARRLEQDDGVVKQLCIKQVHWRNSTIIYHEPSILALPLIPVSPVPEPHFNVCDSTWHRWIV